MSLAEHMSLTKFFIHTTGCKANQWDSHAMAGRLMKKGYEPAAMAQADVIIVNACTVTEGAVRDLRRFCNHARRRNPDATLVLAGCHAQVYPGEGFGAHLVLGQAEKFRIDEFLGRTGVYVEGGGTPAWDASREGVPLEGKTRAFLKIQDGCDKYCAYCIVPYARGAPRSRPWEDIAAAMGVLEGRKVPEVVLTGIEIGSYRDPASGMDFVDLMERLEDERTPPRIRISSIDPAVLDERFIGAMARSRKLARSLHLPVQSGSDRILERMGRRHSTQQIARTIEMLRTLMADVGIGMDIITGFPGEGEEEFSETVQFVESVPVYYLHVFPFSPRPGTAAASFAGAVPKR